MDEARIEPNANFDSFRNLLRGVVEDIIALQAQDVPLAAE